MPLDRRLRDDLQRAADSVEPDTEGGLERVRRRSESRSGLASALLTAAAVVVVIVFVIVILPGRRQDGSVPAGVDHTASPAPIVHNGGGILGSWTVSLSTADTGVADLSMTGDWTMRLGADATIDLRPPDAFEAPSGEAPTGYVHAEDDDSFLTTLFARDFSASCTGSGTYTWVVTGDHLAFTAVDDTCDARRILLTSAAWSRLASNDPG